MNSNRLAFKVNLEESDRLDKYLALKLPDFSRSRLQALIKEGVVMVDQQAVTKTGFVVEQGSVIEILVPETVSSELIPEKIDLDVIFENSDLAVINKPAGMVVHPAAGHDTGLGQVHRSARHRRRTQTRSGAPPG